MTIGSKTRFLVVVLFAIGAVVFDVVYPNALFLNLRRHAEKWNPILKANPRFAHVFAGPFTGCGGSVLIRGEVERTEDADALRALVERQPHSITVALSLTVNGERYWRELPPNAH